MKHFWSLMFIFVFHFPILAQSQNEVKWTRIETENKEISVAFPLGFIVDAEKEEFKFRRRIFAFLNGSAFELAILKRGDSKAHLASLQFIKRLQYSEFKLNKIKGLKISPVKPESKFNETLLLASDEYFYIFDVRSDSSQKEEVKRFLFSIKVNGKPLYARKEIQEFAEEVVSANALTSSPDVLEAYNRKIENSKINITFKGESEFTEEKNPVVNRPPIIFNRPDPRFGIPGEPPNEASPRWEIIRAKFKIKFLANGQIGDITVYSNETRQALNFFVQFARQIRFIPAVLNGKPVDFTETLDYTMFHYVRG